MNSLKTQYELYSAATPNGLKAKLFLEETASPHRFHRVDIGKGEQHAPDFLKISPNGKIPALVDSAPEDGGEPIALFESCHILLYLAEKTGRFFPQSARQRLDIRQWLFWQAAGQGPMAGQAGHFRAHAKDKIPYAIDRYTKETARLYGVLDNRLEGRDFIVGDYSIADMAAYPWTVSHAGHGQSLDGFPNLKRWFERVGARPAVQRVFKNYEDPYVAGKTLSDEERRILLAAPQPASREKLQ